MELEYSDNENVLTVDGKTFVAYHDDKTETSCYGCCFVFGDSICLKSRCTPSDRNDGRSIIWIERGVI